MGFMCTYLSRLSNIPDPCPQNLFDAGSGRTERPKVFAAEYVSVLHGMTRVFCGFNPGHLPGDLKPLSSNA